MRSLATTISSVGKVLCVSLLFLFLCECALRTAVFVKRVYVDMPRSVPDVYAQEPWAVRLAQEAQALRAQWVPYTYWRSAPFSGQYINADHAGLRKTVNNCSSNTCVKIFLFGGSTLWGVGARDEYTIASSISKKLHQRGYRNVEIVNFGQQGYVNTQEFLTLLFEIRKKSIPAIAIFYDGINDVHARIQQGVPGVPENEKNRTIEFNSSQRFTTEYFFELLRRLELYRLANRFSGFLPRAKHVAPVDDANSIAKEVVDTYFFNRERIVELSKTFNIDTYFFWQPTLFDKKKLSPYEESSIVRYQFYGIPEAYTRASALFSKHVSNKHIEKAFSLSDAFKDIESTIFLDTLHTSEAGNDIIAEKILSAIRIPNSAR